MIIQKIGLLLCLISIASCTNKQGGQGRVESELTGSVKITKVPDVDWVAVSPEYDGLSLQTFMAATSQLESRLKSDDSALSETEPGLKTVHPQKQKAAIIVDVDETVISNLDVQKQFQANGKYDANLMVAWQKKGKASAMPGALEFLQLAAQKGVTIFYVTNRGAAVEKGTRKNLASLGFPLSTQIDTVLMKNERKNWTGDKASRRLFVEKDFRVIMLIGDDLNDFISAKHLSKNARDEAIMRYKNFWGNKWFLLPNPMYGSWQKLIDQ